MVTKQPPVPAWWDSGGAMTQVSWRRTTLSLVANTLTLLVRADPTRVALGTASGVGAVASYAVAPGQRAQAGGFATTTTLPFLWFTLFEYGPLVCSDWTVYSSGILSLDVYEVYRLY